MEPKNPLTVSPTSGLAELKRAKSLIRLTESVLGKPIVPARNRTDEQGRKQGRWVERDVHGNVFEGTYVDGKKHGHWVLRYYAHGGVAHGGLYDGDMHWVCDDLGEFFDAPWSRGYRLVGDGDVHEGAYKNGKQHGHWVERAADGCVEKGSYKNGKKHGHWVKRDSWGVAKGPYKDGKKHGKWVEQLANDTAVVKGSYVDGKRHGKWVFQFADGDVEEVSFKHNAEMSKRQRRFVIFVGFARARARRFARGDVAAGAVRDLHARMFARETASK